MSRLAAIISAVVICLVVCLGWLASHYHDNATEFKRQRDEKVKELNLANETITDMTTRQRDIAALDAKYTGELADAKATIDQLERDVASGKRRLQLNATCPKNRSSSPASSTGVDDADRPGLTDSAQRDYFTLRSRIETAGKQIAGLQQYIREQCLN
ncbi:lysis protein [Klebsiella pneumoniae]|nr:MULTISPECIES: lysis protein [Klebsiella]EIY5141622.1 lysis protein [Klebsiella variicola]RDB00600.1 lysis protein [Klebsiella oxytoca]HDT2604986.1 lysis protein [Klebsiella quasipneumoniae subsp. similipneumoniae]ARS97898.1 lysis protein [Klebsiella pneumoniae]EIV5802296.1 lysis protein [Klebsiella pneumoniae]